MVVQTIETGSCSPQTIVIGRRGTYDTMQIVFDLTYLIQTYGSGTAVLAVKRSQDSSAYPAVVSQDGNTLTWIVSDVDTYYVGSGECQLMWYVDGGLAKTIIYPMVVMRDILSTAEEAPDAYQEWVDNLTALGAETLQHAQAAAESAADAEDAKNDAVTAKGAAETAQEAAEEAQDKAETAVSHYPVIINGYWNVWSVEAQTYVSTGVKAKGEDGYSPEVTITTITGGHRVTITDKDHPQGQSFDVMDGQGGGGTSDYTDLTNKPQINGHTLSGNQTAAQLGLATPSDIPTVPVQSVAGRTGAVVLNAGDSSFNASETYSDGTVGKELSDQKNAISQLESEVVTDVTVTGTDVTIVAQANKRYLCGTVSTIAVTPCATGAFDLIFTSGSSAAILTIPSTVKWQDTSFDPTALDTDTIYEISVADGTLGLVAKWT